MAKRPVFVPVLSKPGLVDEVLVDFPWAPGMAPSQKMKNVVSLHAAAHKRGIEPILEISTKSQLAIGTELSAFNLLVFFEGLGRLTVEAAFQGSKVFRNGGPYREFYRMKGRDIKQDERLRNSGDLLRFDLDGDVWGLEPTTAFYDWIYLHALQQNLTLGQQVLTYQGFTDIEFNPEKSFNCQARSAALFVALSRRGLLEQALQSKQNYLAIINEYTNPKRSPVGGRQLSFGG